MLQLPDVFGFELEEEDITYDIAFCGRDHGVVVIVQDRVPTSYDGLDANRRDGQILHHSFLLCRREWVTAGAA